MPIAHCNLPGANGQLEIVPNTYGQLPTGVQQSTPPPLPLATSHPLAVSSVHHLLVDCTLQV